MTKSAQLQLRSSELAEQLNEFERLENPSTEQISEAEKRQAELIDVQKRFRLALQAEERAANKTTTPADPERREFDKLVGRAKLGTYLETILNGRMPSGAEAELRTELGLGGDQIPLDVLLPQRSAQPEVRADAVTPPPSEHQVNQQSIGQRVFADTIASRMGIAMPTVAGGELLYPILTTGASPTFRADDAEADSAAGSFSTATVSPERVAGRISFRGKDAVMLQGMEASLRSDLTSALADQVDAQLLNGDGTSPNLQGLVHGRADANAGAAVRIHTYADVVGFVGALLDGKYARDFSGIQLASHPALMAHCNSLYRANEDATTVLQWLRANTGPYVTSANMPAKASKKYKFLAYLSQSGTLAAVSPIWRGMTVVRDAVTDAKKDWIHATISAYIGAKVLREDAFKVISVQVEA